MKVAIYARVSTRDKQEVRNQLIQLRNHCKEKEWTVYDEYIDKESGANPDRPKFKKLFEDAYQHRFDLVLFWALDRFSREGVRQTINYLAQLEEYGVDFMSYTERYLSSVGMFKDAIISILATLAKQERVRISERTLAGLDRARRQGKRLGRPGMDGFVKDKAKKLRSEGLTYEEIGKKLEIGTSTVYKYVKG